MKQNPFRFLYLALFGAILAGCASMTGVTNWKESRYASSLDREATAKIAAQALARIGKVSFSDTAAGTVSGECEQQVDASIIVLGENGQVVITIKSKLNVKENSMVIETGDRKKCIEHLVHEMESLGCALTPLNP